MDNCHRHNVTANETRPKRVHSMYIYSYDGQEYTKVIFGIISEHSGFIWDDERDFWDAETMLYLDLCDGYLNIYT